MYSNYKILNINARASPPQDKESFPTVKQPIHVGEYSLSAEGHFENSPARICFLNQLPLSQFPFTLIPNVEDMHTKKSKPKPRYLDNLFYFLRCSWDSFIKRNVHGFLQLEADIVCSREALQLIMCAPYEYKNNWTLAVSKYRNTIYICPVHNAERPLSVFDEKHFKDLLMANWMRTLRQHCLTAGGNYLDIT